MTQSKPRKLAMACVCMEEQFELTTVSHNEHTLLLLEDTWAKSATNLLEEWTETADIQKAEIAEKADTHQDADLHQEDVIDTIHTKTEIVTTAEEETDTMTEIDTEKVTEKVTEEITIKASKLYFRM
jgi:hypothetical protein